MADKRIKDITNTATESDIASGNYFVLDGGAGTKKLNSTTLLTKTAQNVLAGNVAPAFDPTRTSDNPYKAGESVAYDGKTYTFKVDHYGAWDADDVKPANVYDEIIFSALPSKYEKVEGIEFTSETRVISSSGQTASSALWKASFYVDVGGCEKIAFTAGLYTSATTTGIAFYNKNRAYISGVAYNVSSALGYELVEVSVPSEAVFAKFSAYNSDSVAGPFTLFKEKKTCVILDATDNVVFEDGYRVSSTGSVSTSAYWAASDYISVDGVSRIDVALATYSSSSVTGMAFYDEYKEFIEGSGVGVFQNNPNVGYHICSLKVPANAKYFRCSRYGDTTEASLSKKFSLKFEVLDTKFFKNLEDDNNDESVIEDIALGTKASLAICCSRDTIEDNRTPYSFAFLGCVLFKSDPWLWYGSSIDKMKKFVKLNGVCPEDMNVAMSPSSNIVIVAKQFERDKLIVVRDGGQTEISTIEGTAPMGWLYNSGLLFFNDSNNVEHCIFAEYTKNHPVAGGKFYVYKGTYPYDDSSLWKKVFSYDESENNTDGYIMHFHHVTRDPWTGILYLTSGDKDNQLHWWYSTDDGENWTELVNIHSVGYDWGSQVLRLVNFVFTEEYIYFAVDNETNHCLNRLSRDSGTGVIDISSRTKLCDLPANQATNSICLVERPYGLFGYDRTQESPVLCWFFDLTTNELKTLFVMPTRSGAYPPTGNRGAYYLQYSSVRTPNPIIGFNHKFYCLFNLNSKISGEIGSLVYNVATGQVSDIGM